MRLHWESVVEPVLAATDARAIVEVGVDTGLLTERLVAWARDRGAKVEAVDPAPDLPDAGWIEEPLLTLHRARSLNVLGRLERVDVAIVDGDHNWYTVRNELLLLERRARRSEQALPVVVLHDVGWPYGRRDLYYDPESIPAAHRHPSSRNGMAPGSGELVDGGLNGHLQNAIYEHGIANGVRTAVEDFLDESPQQWRLETAPGFHGVAVLAPAELVAGNERLATVLDDLTSAPFLASQAARLEEARIEAEIRVAGKERQLASTAASVDEGEREASRLRARCEELQAAVDDLRRTLAASESERSRLTAAGEELERSLAATESDMEEARRRSAAAETDLEDARRQSVTAKRRLRDVRWRSAALAAESRAMRERAEAAEGDTAELAARLDAEAETVRRLERQVEALAAERDGAQADAERARLKRDRAVAERDDAEARRGAADARVAEREAEIGRQGAELRQLRDALSDERAAADSDRTSRVEADRRAAAFARRRRELLEAVAGHVERTRTSRSLRWGHALLRALSRLALRRPGSATALDRAVRAIAELEAVEQAAAAAPARPAPALPASPAPVGAPASSNGATPAPPASAPPDRTPSDEFAERYRGAWLAAGAEPPSEEALNSLLLADRRGVLLARAADGPAGEPSVDVIVCVKDAPDDVRRCLWALLENATRPFHLILVDDGSGPETARMLDELHRREPAVELRRNAGPEHGYARAANIGLRASTADHVVLLNSDTVPGPGWLEALLECADSDERIGIVGPLSNAATHQSVPEVKDADGWAVNELPPWLTPESAALLVRRTATGSRPRVPFVNGFCYAIKRSLLERVGIFDEERFGSGYCEENDLSVRAQDAGFALAVADDAYVYHAKSRSYTAAGRKAVAKRNYERFLDKHGAERIDGMLAELDAELPPKLAPLRERMARALTGEAATAEALRGCADDPLRVMFVLHGMSEGSSGGVHSIYQEVAGLRSLGVPAHVALADSAIDRARAAYPDADSVFTPFDGEDELAEQAAGADVVVATHFSTVAVVARLRERADFVPAYYVQDYEPFILPPDSPQLAEALNSYTAIPGQLLFAKTHWLRNVVSSLHDVHVAKVEPSIDGDVYSTAGRRPADGGRVRVAAMIRPRTPRRQPAMTLDVLSDLVEQAGADVEVVTFGCKPEDIAALGRRAPGDHRGILTRQQVADVLRSSDVFLDASTYQAFGRTALEAMACGCTAVVPRAGGARQFTSHRENGMLVDTADRRAIAATTMELVRDRDLRERLRDEAAREGARHSVLRAALSEYSLFAAHAGRRRAGTSQAGERARA